MYTVIVNVTLSPDTKLVADPDNCLINARSYANVPHVRLQLFPVVPLLVPLSHCSVPVYHAPLPMIPSPQYDPLAIQLSLIPPFIPSQDHVHTAVIALYDNPVAVPEVHNGLGVLPVYQSVPSVVALHIPSSGALFTVKFPEQVAIISHERGLDRL